MVHWLPADAVLAQPVLFLPVSVPKQSLLEQAERTNALISKLISSENHVKHTSVVSGKPNVGYVQI